MTDRYALFGNPLGHTKSPFIHGEFARQLGDDISYEAIEAPVDGFAAAVRDFVKAGGKGFNVTVPFKVEAAELADEAHEAVVVCGASNCVKVEDGQLVAENFDGVGLVRDIVDNLGVALKGRRVLFAGAGGATRGAVVPFLEAGVGEIVIANRTVSKAEAIRDLLGPRGSVQACGYEDISGGFDIVLNSTSASLSGAALPIPPAAFEGARLAYEMAYGKGKTPFLELAERSGAERLADGVGMLVEQAAEAFAWWRGRRPDTAPVIEAMTIPLE
ncbi:shikimate dehydrogenase [Sinisalibacter lacisalsi]|uniref:Shikimate dehydrogenase (NADP(+)) n=1 Tax=Sinisalibacter lacisalsi TaxID=1526570 RepID=A0ABQ1QBL9_9RHOB|nr:shikimate dehydrogenase [Sinisalibacter lacisalsi]GGD22241.1 shikimate dehydrogenase (NADP(+)) [Sinisalibacter lacisalsi]